MYIGNEDRTAKYSIPDFVEWEDYKNTGVFPSKQVDIVILDRDITYTEKQTLDKLTRAYSLLLQRMQSRKIVLHRIILMRDQDFFFIQEMCRFS